MLHLEQLDSRSPTAYRRKRWESDIRIRREDDELDTEAESSSQRLRDLKSIVEVR